MGLMGTFSDWGANPKWRCQPIIWHNFHVNCMKMKKIGPRGRKAPPWPNFLGQAPQLRSASADSEIEHWFLFTKNQLSANSAKTRRISECFVWRSIKEIYNFFFLTLNLKDLFVSLETKSNKSTLDRFYNVTWCRENSHYFIKRTNSSPEIQSTKTLSENNRNSTTLSHF